MSPTAFFCRLGAIALVSAAAFAGANLIDSIADGEWFTPATWDTSVPDANDVAVLNHAVSIDTSDVTVLGVNFAAGGALALSSGNDLNLTLNSTWAGSSLDIGVGSEVNLQSGATLLLTDNNMTLPGYTHTATGAGAFRVRAGSTLDGLTSGGVVDDPTAQLDFAGALFQWEGGELVDGTVENVNQINLVGGNPKVISGRLRNSASIMHDGAGDLELSGGLALDNRGTYQFTGDGDITDGGGGRLDNTGTIQKTAGLGTSSINGIFNNSGGTLDVQSGILRLANTSTFADTSYQISAGAEINLTSGRTLLLTDDNDTVTPAQHVGAGAGVFRVSAGAVLDGSTSGVIPDPTAQLNFPGDMFQWDGGTLVDGTVENIGQINLTGIGGKSISGRLRNSATITHPGDGGLTLAGLALVNAAGALYDFQSDADIFDGGSARIENFGTLRKSSGTGNTIINGTLFNDGGVLDIQSGDFTLDDIASFQDTQYQIATGASLILPVGATLTLTTNDSTTPPAVHTGTGAGQFVISGGTLDGLTTSGIVDDPTAQLDFATGMLQWQSGALLDGTVENIGEITFSGAQARTISGRLLNSGTLLHPGTGALILQGTALINATGAIYDIASDADVSDGGGGQLDNRGVVRKSGGIGTSTLNGEILSGGGTFEVQTGTMRFAGQSSFNSTFYQISPGARIEYPVGSVLTLTRDDSTTDPKQHVGTGGGRFELSGGVLDGLTTTGVIGVTAQLDFEPGMFQWSSGSMVDGTIENLGEITLTASGAKTIGGRLRNSGLVIHAGTGNLELVENAFVNSVDGTYRFTGNATLTDGGNGLFSNSGTIEKTSGTGASTIAVSLDHDAGLLRAVSGVLALTGDFNFNGGVLQPEGSGRISHVQTIGVPAGAALRGTGTVQTPLTDVSGSIEPGLAAGGIGTLSIQGDLNLRAGASAAIDITGLASNDVIAVSGQFTPGGQFNITFSGGYAPNPGDQFTLLTSSGFTGGVDGGQISIFGLADGAAFSIMEVAGNLVLESINGGQPELPVIDVPPPQALSGGDAFGGAVDVDGNWLVVGIPGLASSGNGSGAIAIYQVLGGEPVLDSTFTIPDGFTGSGFGTDVALSGDTLVAGTDGTVPVQKGPASALAAAIFQRAAGGGAWGFKEPLTAASGSSGDGFGSAVAINGNQVVVGAPGDGDGETTASGAAYVFERLDAQQSFSEMAKLKPPILDSGARFGAAVAIRNQKLAVGAPLDTLSGGGTATTGSVSIYDALGAGVNRLGTTAGSNSDEGAEFGAAVEVGADGTVIVGAPMETSPGNGERQGAAYLFNSAGGIINQTHRLTPANSGAGNRFGQAVTIDRTGIAVGAPGSDLVEPDAGLVHRFDRVDKSEGTAVRPESGWTGFGQSLSLSGDRLVIGAPDSNAAAGVTGLVLDPDRVFSNGFE